MSNFSAQVVRIRNIQPLPNSDTLSTTEVVGYPVIFKTGDYMPEDLAVYVPVDAMVPLARPEFAFLDSGRNRTHERVRAKKLRGTYSEGLLISVPSRPVRHLRDALLNAFRGGFKEGDDVTAALGIFKYEEAGEEKREKLSIWTRRWRKLLYRLGLKKRAKSETENIVDPGAQVFPYYDLEPVRKYQHCFELGEEVVLTEKIHGANARFGWYDDRFWIGSHARFKNPKKSTMWARVALELDLANKLKALQSPHLAVYGEVYGQVQDIKYGAKPGELLFRVFDIYDRKARRWLDHDEVRAAAASVGLLCVPELYRGPWKGLAVHAALAEEDSALAKCIREGWVVRPTKERYIERIGRVVFKYVGQRYLLRKGGTEKH